MLPKQTPYKQPVVLAAVLVVEGAELDGHNRFFVVFSQGEKDHPLRGMGGKFWCDSSVKGLVPKRDLWRVRSLVPLTPFCKHHIFSKVKQQGPLIYDEGVFEKNPFLFGFQALVTNTTTTYITPRDLSEVSQNTSRQYPSHTRWMGKRGAFNRERTRHTYIQIGFILPFTVHSGRTR